MNPQERALFEKLGEMKWEKRMPAEWARLAWPTAFTCKRTGKPKVPRSQANAESKCEQILKLFASKKLVEWEWAERQGYVGMRVVYWRE